MTTSSLPGTWMNGCDDCRRRRKETLQGELALPGPTCKLGSIYMQSLLLHDFHELLGARFGTRADTELVLAYEDGAAEYTALHESAVMVDLSFRGRLCITGADRVRFLHGQVTNDIKRLQLGQGCYAALVDAKGRMESDLNVFCLTDELLLDFEPGLTRSISQRLDRYIVADDVQVVDVGPLYGLLTVQGPQAEKVIALSAIFGEYPKRTYSFNKSADAILGELYLMNVPRLARTGFDIFAPADALEKVARQLVTTAKAVGGGACGWEAFETARIESGVPRFGIDMDNMNFPQECGIDESAVSYSKGCYIGQEVLNRIHTMGHVNRELRGLILPRDLQPLPAKGEKLLRAGKEVGWITSTVFSPALKENIALGIVRKEAGAIGTELEVRRAEATSPARVVGLPFKAA